MPGSIFGDRIEVYGGLAIQKAAVSVVFGLRVHSKPWRAIEIEVLRQKVVF